MVRNLDRLLRPKSITVIGGKEAAAVIAQCRKIGFEGEIWPVHPHKTGVCGLKTYSSIEQLPSSPDAAYVAVNRQNTISIIEALNRIKCGGAICYASGFLEADSRGGELQAALVNAAGNMPIIGPNCYGLINYLDGIALWPDQHGGQRLGENEHGVAIITQSSNIAINMTMQRRGLPIAYMMTAGNQAQTGLSVLALSLLDDPRVTALGLHVEGFDSIAGFEAVGRKSRLLNKPIVVIKIGRSEKSKAATFSHTAAMAGSDATADAFLKRIGVARVNSVPSFLETLKLLHVHGPLGGFDISSMSCSGGEAGLLADACVGREIVFRGLSEEQIAPVQHALGPMVTIANPLDYHTYIWGDRKGIEAAFSAMLAAKFDFNCLILDFPRDDLCDDDAWWIAVDAFDAASHKHRVKSAIISTMAENLGEHYAAEMIRRGIVPLCGVDEALDAIEAAAIIGRYWKSEVAGPVIFASACPDKVREFDEADAKALLADFGIAVPDGARASNSQTAAMQAEKIGFPVALKRLGLAHKSEHSAVILGLENGLEVENAAQNMEQGTYDYYVEVMVSRPIFELLIGIVRDEQFGLVLTIATGGTMVEVLDDQRTLLLPVKKTEIKMALRQLKSSVFFDGFRGSAKADLSATVEAVLAIAEFALSQRDRLIELEVNPLIVCKEGQGVFAADALLKMGESNCE